LFSISSTSYAASCPHPTGNLQPAGLTTVCGTKSPGFQRRIIDASTRNQKPIQQKIDRLDDAFIYKESIDVGTYERQRDRLREELTLVELDRHGSKVEEFDVEGILNFAERVLPRASDLWIQASLEQRQRLQRLFFPEGVAFSGKAFDRTVVTSSLFEYLRPLDGSNENLVGQIFPDRTH
jgi:hypothetical protein